MGAAVRGAVKMGAGMAREAVPKAAHQNLLQLDGGFEHRPGRGQGGCGEKASRAMEGRASGSEAFTLLLRLLMTHFDGVDTEEGCTKLHVFGGCNGTPFFCDFSRATPLLN